MFRMKVEDKMATEGFALKCPWERPFFLPRRRFYLHTLLLLPTVDKILPGFDVNQCRSEEQGRMLCMVHPNFHGFDFIVETTRTDNGLYHIDHRVYKTLHVLLELVKNTTIIFTIMEKPHRGLPVVEVHVQYPAARVGKKRDRLLQIADLAEYCAPWESDEDILWRKIVYRLFKHWVDQNDGRVGIEKTIKANGSQHSIERVMQRRLNHLLTNVECFNEDLPVLKGLFPLERPFLRGVEFGFDSLFIKKFLAEMYKHLHQEGTKLDTMHPMSSTFHSLRDITTIGLEFSTKETLFPGARQLFGRITKNGCDIRVSNKTDEKAFTINGHTPFVLLQFLLCCEYHKVVDISILQAHVTPLDLFACFHRVYFFRTSDSRTMTYMPQQHALALFSHT